MAALVVILALAAVVLPSFLSGILLLEVVASRFGSGGAMTRSKGERGRVAVLIPAHNEALGIAESLAALMAQLSPSNRVLVVADNCTDDTADIARAAGAEVIERHEPERRGKGYALAFGVQHLAKGPPDVVIVMDADCRPGENAVSQLAQAAMDKGRPVQALYLMLPPSSSSGDHRLWQFTWRIKNLARPLGLRTLGLPCQLMGTGMAFPWPVIRSANLASGHLVEDLKLGLELTRAGHAPLFCPAALVTSEFPASALGAQTQRQRWESGYLKTIARNAVPLIVEAILQRRGALLGQALDLALPPLTLLGLMNILALLFALPPLLLGLSPVPLLIGVGNLIAFSTAIWLSWLWFGRDILPVRDWVTLAPFVRAKLRLYWKILRGQTPSHWVRTDRGGTG